MTALGSDDRQNFRSHFSLRSLPVDSALTLTTPPVAVVPTFPLVGNTPRDPEAVPEWHRLVRNWTTRGGQGTERAEPARGVQSSSCEACETPTAPRAERQTPGDDGPGIRGHHGCHRTVHGLPDGLPGSLAPTLPPL